MDLLLGNHFQNAYVTRNLAGAEALFAERFGLTGWSRFTARPQVTTPAGAGEAVMNVSVVWVGSLQYELIEPVSGIVDCYAHTLGFDHSPRFHHVAMRCHERDELDAKVLGLNLPVACAGEADQLRFAYVDARDQLGHMLEYIWMSPDRWNHSVTRSAT